MDDNKLTIITDDTEEQATIILTFERDGKNYVVFEFDESGDISAAIYVPGPNGNEGDLLDIESDEEWDMIQEVLDEYAEDEEDEDVE